MGTLQDELKLDETLLPLSFGDTFLRARVLLCRRICLNLSLAFSLTSESLLQLDWDRNFLSKPTNPSPVTSQPGCDAVLHLGAIAEGIFKDCHVLFMRHPRVPRPGRTPGAPSTDSGDRVPWNSSLPGMAAQQGSTRQAHAARAVRKSLVICGLLRDKEEPEEAARLEALFGLSDIAALCSCVADTVLSCMDKVEQDDPASSASTKDADKDLSKSFRAKRSDPSAMPLPPRSVAKGLEFAALSLGELLVGQDVQWVHGCAKFVSLSLSFSLSLIRLWAQ